MNSKELEALERLTNDVLGISHYYKQFTASEPVILKDKELIENALKNYEMEHTLRIRLENINYELFREKQENEKKLKALEITKRLINKSGTENWLYETENDYVFADFRISKDEYDLLKEVLL